MMPAAINVPALPFLEVAFAIFFTLNSNRRR